MDGRGYIGFLAGLAAILCGGIVAQVLTSNAPWRSEVAAAWVQAAGSIVAIIASTGIALYAPLHLREVEAKAATLQAYKNSISAGAMVLGAWKAIRLIYEEKRIDDGTPVTMGAQIASLQAILAEVPRRLLGPDALLAIGVFESHAAMLIAAIPHLQISQNDPTAAPLPFDELEANLSDRLASFDTMGAVKIGGVWHVDYLNAAVRDVAYREEPELRANSQSE